MTNSKPCDEGAPVKCIVYLLASVALLLQSTFCGAQEGNFDPTFNGGRELVNDGTRDLTFGSNGDGRVHYTAGEDFAIAFDAQIDASDRIVVGGEVATSGATTGQWVVDRLLRNGQHDADFNRGNAQLISLPPGDGGYISHLALMTNDGIFAIGITPRTLGNSANCFAVVHVNADGSLDSRFGNGGRSYGSFTSTNDVDTDGIDIVVGNGRLTVAGLQEVPGTNGNSSKFAIGRLKYDQIFRMASNETLI